MTEVERYLMQVLSKEWEREQQELFVNTSNYPLSFLFFSSLSLSLFVISFLTHSLPLFLSLSLFVPST